MLSYIIRRLLILPLILLGVTFLIFCLFSLLSPMERLATYINDPSVLKNPQSAQSQCGYSDAGSDEPIDANVEAAETVFFAGNHGGWILVEMGA